MPASASHVCQIATPLEMRFHIRHGGNPLLQQQILKPCAGKPFQAVPHHVVVLRLRNATAIAKRSQNLVEYSSERRKHLIHAPDKNGPFSCASTAACSAGRLKRFVVPS